MDVGSKPSLKGIRVTVMGLGSLGGGEGTVRWLCAQGARVLVTDLKNEAELGGVVGRLHDCEGIDWRLGRHEEVWFTETDMVVRNPAVRRNSPFLDAARRAGVPIEMDSSLLIKYAPTANIIGVTGTKGKTTTAKFLAHMLGGLYRKVWLVGVDGESLLGNLAEVGPEDVMVAELSSWRLEAVKEHRLSLPGAVVTSLYPDHLNTYASLEEYYGVKRSIIEEQTEGQTAVLNYDDPEVRKWEGIGGGSKYWFSGEMIPENGIGQDGEKLWYAEAGQGAELADVSDLPIQNQFSRRNLLPGIWWAVKLGESPERVREKIRSFKGLPHRQEEVAKRGEVRFVNDSAATIPEASCVALLATAGPVVLIAGGNNKGLEYEAWAECVKQSEVKQIIWLPGNATLAMKAELEAAGVKVLAEDAETMTEAVRLAQKSLSAGTVLLSPGATSFGSFQNEFERGNAFREAVLNLVNGKA